MLAIVFLQLATIQAYSAINGYFDDWKDPLYKADKSLRTIIRERRNVSQRVKSL